VTKARIIYMLTMASLFAYFLALYVKPFGVSDGGNLNFG
jgi:hypothetical protein